MAIGPQSLMKRQDNIPWREIDEEGILLNLKDGNYFVVDEVGLFIWKLLDGKKSLGQIVKGIVSNYSVVEPTALADIMVFVKNLYKKGLVLIM